MDEVTLAKESYQLVRKDLGLEEEIQFEGFDNAFDRLLIFLTKQINELLDHDFNRLLNALYRIDIPENQVKCLLESTPPNEIAAALAAAVIEREKQKVLTRLKYRS
ncbi:MAG: hypothetical protein Tsb0034_24610 [Ekhidna sp.]